MAAPSPRRPWRCFAWAAVCLFSLPLPAEEPAPGPLVAGAAAEKSAARLTEDLPPIEEERHQALAALRADYSAQLTDLVQKLTADGRRSLAMAARVEKARVESGRDFAEEMSTTTAPWEVLQLRAPYLEKVRAAHAAADLKAVAARRQSIAALEQQLAAVPPEGRADLEARLQRARALLPVPREAPRTAAIGGPGGGPFTATGGEGALLIGLKVKTAWLAEHLVLGAAQPIFRSAAGDQDSSRQPESDPGAITLRAAPGYAVGALDVRSGDRVDGLDLVFMRIKPGGQELDPDDSYTSAWAGGNGGSEPVRIGRGVPHAGIFGASGLELDSIGLVEAEAAAPAAGHPPRLKMITRENPATLTVASLQPEPLTAAAAEGGGRWRTVPEALRGATIFDLAAPKHNGVAEYTIVTAGRVYVACNYDYQGNGGGDWKESRWTANDFEQNGWAMVEGLQLVSWQNRVFCLFTRELQAGETARLRCNKYEPPYLITFAPAAPAGPASTLPDHLP